MTSPVVTATQDWALRAACRGLPAELWFPHPGDFADKAQAVAVCRPCPVRAQCLEAAMRAERTLPSQHRYGVWGGLGPHGRQALAIRQHRGPVT